MSRQRTPPGSQTQYEDVQLDNENDTRTNTTEAWQTVLETLKQQDKEITDNWKDELNNLLIFAGLFSAVVTAFTIESYSWLQQDPMDISNRLLERISLQLSSFSVGIDVVNSTVPAMHLQQATSSFNPGSIAIYINVLWVLSLTLSLLSAFFAITVQQWLRHLHLPPDLPVRRAVQLRQLRHEGLHMWQVPGIVALLPLLLQIAVILFLVGLLILLRSLDPTVTAVFATIATIGAIAFLVTVSIPLITSECPYKSPIVPTMIIVLQWLTYPLALVLAAITTAITYICQRPIEYVFIRHGWQILPRLYFTYIDDPHWRLRQYVRSFGAFMLVDISRFWFLREFKTICKARDVPLDCEALAASLLSAPNCVFEQISCCSQDFTVTEQQRVALECIRRVLPASTKTHHVNSILSSQVLSLCQRWLSSRHYSFLTETIPKQWLKGTEVTWECAELLCFLHQMHTAFGPQTPALPKILLRITSQQVVSDYWRQQEIVPVSLLCANVASSSNKYIFSEQETSLALRAALDSVEISKQSAGIYSVQSRFLFSAIALASWSHHIKTYEAIGTQLVREFAASLEGDFGESAKSCFESLVHIHQAEPERFPLIVLSKAVRLMCKSLVVLAEQNAGHLDCYLVRLAQHLGELCQNQQGEDFDAARGDLGSFARLLTSAQYQASDLEPTVASPVSTERRLSKSTANWSEPIAESGSQGRQYV